MSAKKAKAEISKSTLSVKNTTSSPAPMIHSTVFTGSSMLISDPNNFHKTLREFELNPEYKDMIT